MRVIDLLTHRLARGLSLTTIGPNEARLLYDALFALYGAVAAAGLGLVWGESLQAWRLTVVVAAFMLASVAIGVYGRFRLAAAPIKALALVAAAVVAVGVGWLIGLSPARLVLWTLLVLPPVVVARLLLSLPYSPSAQLNSLVVNRHGPVVVVGGAGYIGSHTVDLLLRGGHKVRVLDRLMYGQEALAPFLSNPNFELVEGDATDVARLSQALRNASAVIHLAGLVGDPACAVDPEFTRHTNIVATRMAKDVAQGLGIHRFIFASSCSVYGMSDKEVREGDDLNPVSLYAQTKIDSERELLHNVRDDFFVTVLRFATVFGHSFRPRFDLVANLFTAQAMINGQITVIGPDQWRPFVHVRDLARAIVAVLDADPAKVQSQIFNVGDGRLNLTVGQLGTLVRDVVSAYRPVTVSVTDNPQDRRNYAVSFEKIQTVLGFQAETLIEAGVREMAEHFAHGEYRDFRDPIYSNVLTTQRVLHEFYDQAELARLYGPLSAR